MKVAQGNFSFYLYTTIKLLTTEHIVEETP